MRIKTKNYKLKKTQFYYKNKKVLFLFDTYNSNMRNWLNIEQKIKKSNFKYYKILNVITKKFLKKTIFKNFSITINSPLKLIYLKNVNKVINIKKLEKNIFSGFKLFTIKLNNRLYSRSQIKNIEVLDYKNNMYKFKKTLESFFKINTLILIKNSK